MTSPNVQTEHNTLMAELIGYISSGVSLDEMSKARYLRRAKQLPDYSQMYTIESLVHTANYNQELAKESALQAYRYGSGSPIFMNTISTLCINGYTHTAFNLLVDNSELAVNPSYARGFGAVLTKAPSYELILPVIKTIESSQIQEHVGDVYGGLLTLASFMHKGITRHALDETVYSRLTQIATAIAEESSNAVINQCHVYPSYEDNEMTMVFFVEDEPGNVADLNWALGEQIIEAGLDELPIVARFNVKKEAMARVRGLSAD